MSGMSRGSDEWVRGVLSKLPRQDPPSLSLEEILERGRLQRRRRLMIGGGLAVAAAGAILLVVSLFGGTAEPPPEHLDLKVVDVPSEDGVEPQPETLSWVAIPQEAQGP
jgi:hypothetical protein